MAVKMQGHVSMHGALSDVKKRLEKERKLGRLPGAVEQVAAICQLVPKLIY